MKRLVDGTKTRDVVSRPVAILRGMGALDTREQSETMAANQCDTQVRREYEVQTIEVRSAAKATPAARGGATITQAADGKMYLIGGANRDAQSFGDVYVFDFETKEWTLAAPAEGALPARSGHSSIVIGDDIYVFGGMNLVECAMYEDVLVFNTRSRRWSKPLVEGWMPGARNAHAAIRLPSLGGEHRMLVYGGSSPQEGAFSDVYILHIPTDDGDAPLRWERRECFGSEAPEARELHVVSFLTPATILFSGGRNKDGGVCTDMALLDIDTWHWTLIPICEWNRCSHVAASLDGVIVSFGGFDGGTIRNDCWEYVDAEESWLPATLQNTHKRDDEPETDADAAIVERFGHCACIVDLPDTPVENAGKRPHGMLVFGGMNAQHDLSDLLVITRKC